MVCHCTHCPCVRSANFSWFTLSFCLFCGCVWFGLVWFPSVNSASKSDSQSVLLLPLIFLLLHRDHHRLIRELLLLLLLLLKLNQSLSLRLLIHLRQVAAAAVHLPSSMPIQLLGFQDKWFMLNSAPLLLSILLLTICHWTQLVFN